MEFSAAVKVVLRFEGGYSFDPQDPGGETNFGISKRAHPNLDIKNLTQSEAAEIYRSQYWDYLRCEEFPSDLRLVLFDAGVNHGPKLAVSLLQTALGMTPTGKIDQALIDHTNTLPSFDLVRAYALSRLKQYSANSMFKTYGGGWVRRLLDVALMSIGASAV